MEILFVLIPLSLCLVMLILWAFVWSVKNNQFQDLEKESYRILFNDDSEQFMDSSNSGSEDKEK